MFHKSFFFQGYQRDITKIILTKISYSNSFVCFKIYFNKMIQIIKRNLS